MKFYCYFILSKKNRMERCIRKYINYFYNTEVKISGQVLLIIFKIFEFFFYLKTFRAV